MQTDHEVGARLPPFLEVFRSGGFWNVWKCRQAERMPYGMDDRRSRKKEFMGKLGTWRLEGD
jgi:hypothetical protein